MFYKYSSKYTPRESAWNALDAISDITAKCKGAVPDMKTLSAEDKAFLQMRVINLRESLRNVPKRFAFYDLLRKTRNKIGHSERAFDDVELSTVCSYVFRKAEKIKADLERYIEKTFSKGKAAQFEKFGSKALGSGRERKQLVDAMHSFCDSERNESQKISFPNNRFSQLSETVLNDIFSHSDIKAYSGNHCGFTENIQTDILEWLKKTNSALTEQNPFVEEAAFIKELKSRTAESIASDIGTIQHNYSQLPSISPTKRGAIEDSIINFDFYQNSFAALEDNAPVSEESEKSDSEKDDSTKTAEKKWKDKSKLEPLAGKLIDTMEKNLLDRKNKWEQNLIDELRKQFLDELYQKIQNFIKLERLVSPFIDNLGYLWDLSNRPFEASGFEILKSFANILEQDESLQELAEILGKQSRTQSVFEKELRDKVVIKTEWHPKNAYRGQINGLTYSNDISTVLPSELALLENPKTRKLFELKYAQKQLLSFKYINKEAVEKSETEQEEVSVEKKEPKGPIIVCVDTSGSMHGTPENIAKTVTFALSKIAMEEERKCYLISFSTGIETLDMSDFKSGDALTRIVQFLHMSFNGGTDASPALRHAVQMLQKDGYKNADVLMISDFVMGTLPDDLVKAIEAEKEKNTDFYSLVIGSSGNQGTIACFNHNWVYNTSDANAARHLAEQLHELKTRK